MNFNSAFPLANISLRPDVRDGDDSDEAKRFTLLSIEREEIYQSTDFGRVRATLQCLHPPSFMILMLLELSHINVCNNSIH